jgi:hypothetical protein
MAVAIASNQMISGDVTVEVVGGHKDISAVKTRYMDWMGREIDPADTAGAERAYMSMLQAAEFALGVFKISREAQS